MDSLKVMLPNLGSDSYMRGIVFAIFKMIK